ncbi:TPA: ilv operon leader peptide [Proteus mirabilis]|nr:ilv operon leader peptide [Proteus mirabilis]MBI6498864.1 ilv operon leader peptide [Proteus mirabilis]HCT9185209.1 ilv operon leader peptide [Proteus mirabilis]HCT9196122.1 ilv operon leader peptide [Proteus mirabilis]HCT9199717.1 ilv operon leader peptide [Proteus mirabilis]
MNTIVLVISLIIVSVVVIITPLCGAALGRRKAN